VSARSQEKDEHSKRTSLGRLGNGSLETLSKETRGRKTRLIRYSNHSQVPRVIKEENDLQRKTSWQEKFFTRVDVRAGKKIHATIAVMILENKEAGHLVKRGTKNKAKNLNITTTKET